MIKAKIILVALSVFATVGGALAFNAQRFLTANGITSYVTTNAQGDDITLCKTTNFRLTVQGGGAVALNTYTTYNILNGACGPVVATFSTAVD